MDFDGKVVLVTGSSSGIGEATARAFSAAGATVVVNSKSSVADGERVAAELRDATYVQADVADEADVARLLDTALERHGRLDVLVNNAGTTEVIAHHDLAAAGIDVWRRIFETNVFGTWSVTVAAMDALRATRGAVVNVSSIAGLRPTGSSIPYAASKAALNHLTVLLAKVVGPEVRVNAVAPGLVDTPWTKDWDEIRALVSALAPLKRSGKPTDVADVVVALASAPYVTGQVVAIDGGLTLVS
ncbi:MAG TPA: glucose 1-dehydrogenase [Acidimicrobiales bacterium]|jgi:ketoreductase RED2|nr:glucose 1-dehydrogenase [Acidimicrobiales bacterium]